MWKPAWQGSLDGLCGLYAITNALWACGFNNSETILREAAKALPKTRWPDVLLDGTTYADLQKMVRHLINLEEFQAVSVRYPFQRNVPSSNTEYWKRFRNLFDEPNVRCAILGIEQPWGHWIVSGLDGGRIQFMDSTAGNQLVTKKISTLHAGSRRQKAGQWLLNPKELILFSVE